MPGGSGVWGVPGNRDEEAWQEKQQTSAIHDDRAPPRQGVDSWSIDIWLSAACLSNWFSCAATSCRPASVSFFFRLSSESDAHRSDPIQKSTEWVKTAKCEECC
jgi:hypothetical protein